MLPWPPTVFLHAVVPLRCVVLVITAAGGLYRGTEGLSFRVWQRADNIATASTWRAFYWVAMVYCGGLVLVVVNSIAAQPTSCRLCLRAHAPPIHLVC